MRKIYSFKCKKWSENKNEKICAFNGRIMLSPIRAVCNKKNNKFIKKQEFWELVSLIVGISIPYPSLI